MDTWTKKKRAAESCGGKGMTKFVDSTEARRLSRLKNMKSSIGSKMMVKILASYSHLPVND
jgi:hypothetical protein